MKIETITIDWLKMFDACEEGIKFFEINRLEGFPVSMIPEIKGDYKGFVWWIRNRIHVDCQHDKNGNIVRIDYPSKNFEEWEFDDLNNLIFEKSKNGEYRYEYDEYNNLISKIDLISGKTQEWKYDKNNKVYFKDWDGEVEEWKYDETGKLKISTVCGVESLYEYDEKGNLVKIKYSDDTERNMKYDERGNLIYDENNYGDVYEYSYDENGNMSICKFNGTKVEFGYDKSGNKILERMDDCYELIWQFDDKNNLIYHKNDKLFTCFYDVEYYPDGQLKRYNQNVKYNNGQTDECSIFELPWFEKNHR